MQSNNNVVVVDHNKIRIAIKDNFVSPDEARRLASKLVLAALKAEEGKMSSIAKRWAFLAPLPSRYGLPSDFPAALLTKVEDIDFSKKLSRSLRNDNIVYLGDALMLSKAAWLRAPGFGRKSLNELTSAINAAGFDLPSHGPGQQLLESWALLVNSLDSNNVNNELARLVIMQLSELKLAPTPTIDPKIFGLEKYVLDQVLLDIKASPFSLRMKNAFSCFGLIYVGDLLFLKEKEILEIPNVGKDSLREVAAYLNLFNLGFGSWAGNPILLERWIKLINPTFPAFGEPK